MDQEQTQELSVEAFTQIKASHYLHNFMNFL